MKFKLLWVLISIIFLGMIDLHCEDASPAPVEMTAVAKALAKYFQSLNSWDLSVTRTLVVGANKPMDNTDGKATGNARFYFEGGRYRTEDYTDTSERGDKNHLIAACDGHTQQVFRYEDSCLAVLELNQGVEKASEYWFRKINPVLMAFEFLSLNLVQGDYHDFAITEFKEQKVFDAFPQRVLNLRKESVNGDTQWILDVKGGVEYYTQQPSVYRVYLSAKHQMLPVKWERFTNEGKLIHDYTVESFDKAVEAGGLEILYPAAVRTRFFGGNKEFPVQESPVTVMEWRAKLNSVNRPIDPELFSIDPSVADSIYDINNKTRVKVPR